jgi:hypothetical protein
LLSNLRRIRFRSHAEHYTGVDVDHIRYGPAEVATDPELYLSDEEAWPVHELATVE